VTTEKGVNENIQEQSQPSPPPPPPSNSNRNHEDTVVEKSPRSTDGDDDLDKKKMFENYDDLPKRKSIWRAHGGADVGYLAGVPNNRTPAPPRPDVEQPSRGTVGTTGTVANANLVVPPAPELSLQQNVSSKPGAFAVIPPERPRLRDMLFRRGNAPTPTPSQRETGDATSQRETGDATSQRETGDATPSLGSVMVAIAPRAPGEEASAATVEQLVSATLVPPLSMCETNFSSILEPTSSADHTYSDSQPSFRV
jgi:hypothetical protein